MLHIFFENPAPPNEVLGLCAMFAIKAYQFADENPNFLREELCVFVCVKNMQYKFVKRSSKFPETCFHSVLVKKP